ncbi:hypothetical protein TNCV_4495121 [Trichonephila clavipes]|nr:hypothetical protein TNCV_4495121 [Trichonephila clavipes]
MTIERLFPKHDHHTSRFLCCPSGIVVSDIDCCAVRHGFESWNDMDDCKRKVPVQQGGTLKSVKLVEGKERWDVSSGRSPSKLGWNRTKSYCHLHDAQSYG